MSKFGSVGLWKCERFVMWKFGSVEVLKCLLCRSRDLIRNCTEAEGGDYTWNAEPS